MKRGGAASTKPLESGTQVNAATYRLGYPVFCMCVENATRATLTLIEGILPFIPCATHIIRRQRLSACDPCSEKFTLTPFETDTGQWLVVRDGLYAYGKRAMYEKNRN